MIASIYQARKLGQEHGIPFEDVVFTALNASGLSSSLPYKRLRFQLEPDIWANSLYFGLPVRSGDSPFSYRAAVPHEGLLRLGTEIIGTVHQAYEDTCDSTYPRRNGTVLNLNSSVKSACKGCAFCTTSAQTPRDRGNHIREAELRTLLDAFCSRYQTPDLSHLTQVAVVTGCLGSEERVLDHLVTVRRVLRTYNYYGELFYFGSEIISESALDSLKERAMPFALCLSLECFTRRVEMLRHTKSRISLLEASRLLERAREREFQTTFSYIVGMDSIEDMRTHMPEIIQHTNRFPIMNVFQPHNNPDQTPLRHLEAGHIEYYLSARQWIESLFRTRAERPRPWENYRSLWYTSFSGEPLTGIRTP